MSRPHFYSNLDKDSKLELSASLREVAEQLANMNYGVQRLLSHLVDVRRERLAAKIADYRARGDEDIAAYAARDGDPLADGIEALLKAGLS